MVPVKPEWVVTSLMRLLPYQTSRPSRSALMYSAPVLFAIMIDLVAERPLPLDPKKVQMVIAFIKPVKQQLKRVEGIRRVMGLGENHSGPTRCRQRRRRRSGLLRKFCCHPADARQRRWPPNR